MTAENRSFALLAALLGTLVMMGPVGIDMFLPGIPNLARDLNVTVGQAEFALTAIFSGMAVGQLIYGPLSDRYGRKPVIIGSILLYIISVVTISLAGDLDFIIAMRFVQGMAAASGRIMANAAARDIFEREQLARMLSFVMMVGALVSLFTGTLGGIITEYFSWRIVFLIMAGYGALLLVAFTLFFSETQEAKNLDAIRPMSLVHNYAAVAKNSVFLSYAVTGAFIISGLGAYLNSSSGVLIGAYGVSPTVYGLTFSTIPLGFMSGAFFAARYGARLGISRTIAIGTGIALIGGSAMFGLAIGEIHHAAAVVGPIIIYMFGFAVLIPQISAGALSPFTTIAGSASSLQGFMMSATTAGISALLAVFADGTAVPMAVAILLSALGTGCVYLFWIRPQVRAS
ncbi:MAG: multidrug effflux MFS transporter [Rhodospirillales bacterium]|nr:multidrug effflux MFS transporter [Rhodospirillales bacterium]